MNVHMSRRGFIFGAAAFSIVRPEILMPIKSIELPEWCAGPVWPTPRAWYSVDQLINRMVIDTSSSISQSEMLAMLGELKSWPIVRANSVEPEVESLLRLFGTEE